MEAINPAQPEATPPKASPPAAPTTDASAANIPEYPRELYDEASIENEHRDFNDRLLKARLPNQGKPAYETPPVPDAVVKQTDLEMKAGAERVKHFENLEHERKGLAARTKEAWEKTPAANTPVFRPPDFSEYRNTFKSPAQTPSKDTLRQPPRG